MRRIATLGLLLMLVLALAVSTGCTNVQRGAAAGGILGAAIGGPWAHNSGTISTCGGVAIGLATGGLLGALIGDAYDEYYAEKDNDELKRLQQELADKDRRIKELEDELAKLRAKGEVKEIEKIELSNDILFDSGKARLKPEGQQVIDKAAAYVKKNYGSKEVVVEGHTDNQPIVHSGWKSNWELGAARSLAVLHYMMDKGGFDGKTISAQTFGEYRPVADNGTTDGRQQNRRSVITVMDSVKVKTEEAK